MKKIAILLVSIALAGSAWAQNVEFDKKNWPDDKDGFKEAEKALKEGDEFWEAAQFNSFNYQLAIPHYEVAQNFNPDNAELNYKLGVCYLHSLYKALAMERFEHAYELLPTIARDIHYYIGVGHHMEYDWENAIYHYELYRKVLDQKNDEDLQEIFVVNKKIEECNTGIELMANPVRVWIDNLGPNVNSDDADYSPQISADESVLMFTSVREGSTGDKIDDFYKTYPEDIWECQMDENGEWGQAYNLSNVNTDDHDATSGLSADGRTLFIYYSKKGGGDIYISKMVDGEWGKPQSAGKNINDKEAHEASACLSFDEKRLYFVSDREGGYGGHDIYVSTWDADKEEWGDAVNLGPTINSKYDEESVFMHPDGKTIYFASNGPGSMGGFDIFKAEKDENGNWVSPVNIGYPVNTPDHDQFFVVSASGRHAYYSSFKIGEGEGDRDLYVITFLGPEKLPILNNEDNLLASVAMPIKEIVVEPTVEVTSNNLAILKGMIRDAQTLEPLEAKIDLIDNETTDIISTFYSDSKSGKYLVSIPAGKNYGIAVQRDGYLFHSENFDLPTSTQYVEYVKNIDLNKIAIGEKVVLRNIFYAFDDYALLDESESELQKVVKLLSENPTMKIEMGSHTDSRGSEDYNLELSEKRAKSVVDYLVAHGIAQSRLTYKGHGEEEPIHTDAVINAEPTKTQREALHQENRRTEFTIVGN